MFRVLLTKFDGATTTLYDGWFTAREVKKQISGWLTEYAAVRISPAQVGVLRDVTEDNYDD